MMDKDLWRNLPLEFRPGKYTLPAGQLDVSKDGEIKINLSEIGTSIEKLHPVRVLLSHLSTSEDP